MFADGSRPECGATGHAVAWQKGTQWAGLKVQMGNNWEAYAAECAALARVLKTAARRAITPERVAIFSDAQAAIQRMASEKPGPSQMCTMQALKHIARLRKARPTIAFELRWCPAHKGVPANSWQRRSRGRTASNGPPTE